MKKQSQGNIKIIKGDFPEEDGEEYEDYDYNLHGTVIFIQEPGQNLEIFETRVKMKFQETR